MDTYRRSLQTARFQLFPASEIYGGVGSTFYDYGHYGRPAPNNVNNLKLVAGN